MTSQEPTWPPSVSGSERHCVGLQGPRCRRFKPQGKLSALLTSIFNQGGGPFSFKPVQASTNETPTKSNGESPVTVFLMQFSISTCFTRRRQSETESDLSPVASMS
ncbi:hypothetical protein KUCAC02_003531 [Chaenocephalus aceratus]|uniref:Uncharacterized protein n=1 Tax=Chaenocephalus aceratus TaxID=36190 RepID=A0ACB9WLV3_CHAAC|nr:hypothetical protein KUCAC02_003531 [Chaenocephalus aceratus]